MKLERLIFAKYGGSGSRGSNSNGNRGGGGGMGGGNDKGNKSKSNTDKSLDGRGGQKDVSGQSTSTKDSADTRSGRQTDEQRRTTNPMAASRQIDATTGLVEGRNRTESAQRSFDHARQSMTLDDKRTASRAAEGEQNSLANNMFDLAKVPAGILGGVAGVATVGAVQTGYGVDTYNDNMAELGAPQSTADTVNEVARRTVPTVMGTLAAPMGGLIGNSLAGPVGGLLGAKAVKAGTKVGVQTAMDDALANGGTTPELDNRATGGGQPQQQTAAVSPTQTNTALERANEAFAVGKVNTGNFKQSLTG